MEKNADIRPDAFVQACPSRDILVRLAEKWTFLVVIALENGPMRFGALRRQIEGVSQKMLTQTLRNLEKDGLITRQVYDEMPLRVEYELTALGAELVPLNQAIKQWTEHNMFAILKAREEKV